MAGMIKDLMAMLGVKGGQDKRVVMLGLDASGRTTMLYMLKLGEVITTIPTIGFNVETLEFKHPKLGRTSLTAWDVGGCDKIRPLWRHYFHGLSGIVFFVDSNDWDRMDDVIANKQDLPQALSAAEVEQCMQLECIRDREVHCMPAVATTGEGVWECLEWIAEAMDTYIKDPNRQPKPPPKAEAEEEPLLTQWLAKEDEPDEQFIQALEDFTLDAWDHRTHLRLAWLYLSLYGRREGMRRIFTSIRAFIENSPRTMRGSRRGTTFHATLTYVWAHLVDFAMASTKNPGGGKGSFKGFLVMNPQLSNGGLPLHYYTKKLLFDSPQARTEVVLPDKRPLPSIITNILPLKAALDPSKLVPAPNASAPLSDEQFLSAVRDRSLPGWGHEAMLRVLWACLRLHGVRKGPDVAAHLLRGFQGEGFHVTITAYWAQVLRKLMIHGWAPAVAQLDQATIIREAAWKLEAAARQAAEQDSVQDTRWATALLKDLAEHSDGASKPQPTAQLNAPVELQALAQPPSDNLRVQAAQDPATALPEASPQPWTPAHLPLQESHLPEDAVLPGTSGTHGSTSGLPVDQPPTAIPTARTMPQRSASTQQDEQEWVVLSAKPSGALEEGQAEGARGHQDEGGELQLRPASESLFKVTDSVTSMHAAHNKTAASTAMKLLASVAMHRGQPGGHGKVVENSFLDRFLLESAQPSATAMVPTLPELLAGHGYANEVVKKMVLDQHMYLAHYSKKVVYSEEASIAFVMPDRKPLPSLA